MQRSTHASAHEHPRALANEISNLSPPTPKRTHPKQRGQELERYHGTRFFALAASAVGGLAALGAGAAWAGRPDSHAAKCAEEDEDDEVGEVLNWSGTHSCTPTRVYEPESVAEIEDIVRRHHEVRGCSR